ncbi:MAG: TIR domain-containing protein [Lachnospiraceae bacterium]|nr:TIR domain-containing protein [Candidatus Colinaster equi]
MNLEEMKYDAFISYRHSEVDQYVAVTLHKELEAFRLPHNICKRFKAEGIKKRKIERVFRDRDELPITNNLADPITNALRNSEYLLVICTPRLPESIWCKTEVETFIKMHGRENVFAVLAEGEPSESFPEALLFDENGNPVEPLAADVRGADRRQIHKKIREEVVRLAAPMFSLSYDDLKQRHREQKIRRTITVCGVVAAVCAAFAIVSTASAIKIKAQSVKIKEQADKIEEQYNEAMYMNASSMAKEALDMYHNGYGNDACTEAYKAAGGVDEMPYNPNARYALSECMNVYRTGEKCIPADVLKIDGKVSFQNVSPKKTRIIVADVTGKFYVYNVGSNESIFEGQVGGFASYPKKEDIAFIDEDHIVYRGEKEAVVVDVTTGKETPLEAEDSTYNTLVGTWTTLSGDKFVTAYYEALVVYDAKTYAPLCSIKCPDGYSFSTKAAICRTDSTFAIEYTDIKTDKVLIVDMDSYNTTEYTPGRSTVSALGLSEDYLFVATCDSNGYTDYVTDLEKVDFAGTVVDKCECNDEYITEIKCFTNEVSGNPVLRTSTSVMEINVDDMTLFGKCDCGSSIVNVGLSLNADKIHMVTRDGRYIIYMSEVDLYKEMDQIEITSADIEDFSFGDNYYVSHDYNSNIVTVYNYVVGSDVDKVVMPEKQIYFVAKSQDDSSIATLSYGDMGIDLIAYDLANDCQSKEYSLEVGSATVEYVDNALYVQADGVVYEVKDDELNQVCDMTELSQENFASDRQISASGIGYIHNSGKIYVCDFVKNKLVKTIEIETRDATNDDCSLAYAGNALAYFNGKNVDVYDIENDKVHTFEGNFNSAESVVVSEDGQYLLINYIGNKTEVYSIKDDTLISTWSDYEGAITDMQYIEEYEEYVVIDSRAAYLLDKDYNKIGRADNSMMYFGNNDGFLIFGADGLYKAPHYTLQMLLDGCDCKPGNE